MTRTVPPAGQSLIGRSPEIEEVRRLIGKAARNRLPVLLLGESGSGKEVVARAIHEANPRGRMVPIDCGSLVGTLMESELFGHTRGSFSGATENKKGLVELAHGGTAFFDEIGDLPLEMQVKLLRLMQESEFRAVGSLEWRKVDLRVIAATHRDLKVETARGRFRQDLYFRLNVFPIHLPPLRERPQDIPLLVEYFLAGLSQPGMPSYAMPEEVVEAFLSYDWPGNVRELQHAIERMAAVQSQGLSRMEDLPSALQNHFWGSASAPAAKTEAAIAAGSAAAEPFFERLAPRSPVISVADSERRAIARALEATGGGRARAAQLLGIGRTTLYRKMKEYGVA